MGIFSFQEDIYEFRQANYEISPKINPCAHSVYYLVSLPLSGKDNKKDKLT